MASQVKQFTSKSLTAGYKSGGGTLVSAFNMGTFKGVFTFHDVEAMRRDPRIAFGLWVLKAPIHAAKFNIKATSPAVKAWVTETIGKFWKRDLNKALGMIEWGTAGGEVLWEQDKESGLIKYEGLNDIHLFDMRALTLRGKLIGAKIGNVSSSNGKPIQLFQPRCFWTINEPEFNRCYGRSRLAGCWEPWMEKRGRHGAVDIRRLWMFKNATNSGLMRHPTGTTEVDGVAMDNQQYARQIIEKMLSGATMVLPNDMTEDGKFQWEYFKPEINGDPTQLLEYPKDLDLEIFEGLQIPAEVVQAAASGSGYSGRSVPFIVFLTAEDGTVDNIVNEVRQWILKPGVAQNFGENEKFTVEPVSLLETWKNFDTPTTENSQATGIDQTKQQDYPGAKTPPAPPKVQLSIETSDFQRLGESDAMLESIILESMRAGLAINAELQAKLARIIDEGESEQDILGQIATALFDAEPALAGTIVSGIVAAQIVAGGEVAKQLPARQMPKLYTPPISEGPPGDDIIRLFHSDESEPGVRFPMVDEAVKDLASRNILKRSDYDALTADARATAFTVARVQSMDTLDKIRVKLVEDVTGGGTLEAFRKAVKEIAVDKPLTPAHVENVYRTNIGTAYSVGQKRVLGHPLVQDEFPYLAYYATHDSRVRPNHLLMERLGLNGTNIFRADDPVVLKFWPPWDYQCRCGIVFLTLEDAARKGVREAQEWLATGIPPVNPAYVPMPPFDVPVGWGAHAPVALGFDESKHPRGQPENAGEFGPGGGGKKQTVAKSKGKSKPSSSLPPLSEKAARAKAAHHMIDKHVQRYAEEHNEPRFAKIMRGVSFQDSEPVDVVIADKRGVISHGIELKTVVENKNGKITMKRSAMERKWDWERRNKSTFHTVVLDDNAVFQAKSSVSELHPSNAKYADAHDESKRKIYYRRGVGSFRISSMHEVKDFDELKKLIAMTDDKLPDKAKRTDKRGGK